MIFFILSARQCRRQPIDRIISNRLFHQLSCRVRHLIVLSIIEVGCFILDRKFFSDYFFGNSHNLRSEPRKHLNKLSTKRDLLWARRLAWLGHRSDCVCMGVVPMLARIRRGSWVQVPPSPSIIMLKFRTLSYDTQNAGQPLVLRERAGLS